eukprot:CAMPEP_0170402856 /NCGR_PEP_ID=MMETSP0117_2-20130122/25782_1 /TAXON_ID=400756 /ORGANISM="Durinskia baltica, Strain CSIRO CS-38" /LENGTH=175 /DNA_ID=CAMNT_0010659755 /DNA_START=150 /DNA_END=674 /DNA_ORIENTATION=+
MAARSSEPTFHPHDGGTNTVATAQAGATRICPAGGPRSASLRLAVNPEELLALLFLKLLRQLLQPLLTNAHHELPDAFDVSWSAIGVLYTSTKIDNTCGNRAPPSPRICGFSACTSRSNVRWFLMPSSSSAWQGRPSSQTPQISASAAATVCWCVMAISARAESALSAQACAGLS